MATTKSTKRSENIHGEKTSMFRRMITKLKNVPAEDDLEVVNKIKPTERVSTEPSLREVKECTTGALQEDLQDLQNIEKRSMFRRMINKLKKGTAEDDLDDGSEANLKPSQRGSTEPSIRELMECTGALRENLQDLQDLFQKKQKYTSLFVRRLQEQTEENHRQENEVLSDFAGRLEVTSIMIRQLEENRLAQKDQTIWQLKARVTLLKSDKEWEKTEAESKISELEKRLANQAANTRHRISLKDEEILALKARVLEFEEKGFDETKTPVHSQTLQGKNVLIDPTSIMQDIQKIREENEKRTARQQEVIRKMRQQMEINKGFVKQLKQDLTQQIGPQVNEKVLKDIKVKSSEYNPSPQCANERAVEQVKNRSVSTLLVNGCPQLDADQDNQAKKKEPAAAPPTLLLNGCPLLDDDQDNQAMKKGPAAAPPTLLLNGCPLLLDDDQPKQTKKEPAAAPPTLLLNACPLLLDDDQDNQEKKKKPAAAPPTLLLNGCPLLDDDQPNQAMKKEPAAALPTLLLNGCPLLLDDDQHNQAKEEPAAALPTLLLNGCPLLDADQHNGAKKKEPAAALPTLLRNGCPLQLDADQHNQAKEEPAAALPTLLLNGCPLLLDNDQHNQAKEEPAAALPTLLLNGCPLLDADQHNGAKKKKSAAALPKLYRNGCPLLDTDQHNGAMNGPLTVAPTLVFNGCILQDADQLKETLEEWPTLCISRGFYNPSQASGDSNIKEPPLLPDIELPRFPGFCGVQSFPRSPVEHGDHQHSSVDPAHFLMHPIPLNSFIEHFLLSQRRSASPTEEKECGLGDFYHETSQSASTPEQASSPRGAHSKLNHHAMVLRQSPSIRLRASLESLSTVDVGGGDMKPAPTVAPCRKQEKPHKYREFQQNMSHLDFPALDEPRGLEVLIERKVPQQVWTAPDVVRDGPRGLEIALEESATKEHFHSVQYNVLQRCELNGMFGKAFISNMAAAPCQGKSHKSPAAEGDDVTVPHNPASFPLALLTSRIKKGYRLTTGFC